MAFWTPAHGIAVGDPVNGKFELITTADGGKHWKPIPPENLPPAIAGEGAFAASGTCIAVQGKKNVWFATGGKVRPRISFHRRRQNTGPSPKLPSSTEPTPPASSPSPSATRSTASSPAATTSIQKKTAPTSPSPTTPAAPGRSRPFPRSGISPPSPSHQTRGATGALSPSCRSSVFALGTAHAACADTNATKWQKIWDLNLNAVSVSPSGEVFAVGPKGLIVRFTPDR